MWSSCDFMMKRHITFEQRLGNGNISVLRTVPSCLAINRNALLCDCCRFVQQMAYYRTIYLPSHMDITRSATETQKNVLKPQGHCYNKQTGHNPPVEVCMWPNVNNVVSSCSHPFHLQFMTGCSKLCMKLNYTDVCSYFCPVSFVCMSVF